MKSFSTYLKLQERWSIPQFIESLFQTYGLLYEDIDFDQKRIEGQYFDIYQYPKQQSVVVHLYHRMEYVYNQREGGLYIRNNGYKRGYRYIDELLSHHLVKDDGVVIHDKPLMITYDNCEYIKEWLEHNSYLPVLYVNYEKVVDLDYLASQLRGIAYVVYEENKDIHDWMKTHCQKVLSRSRVTIYYLNDDYKTYQFSKKISQDLMHQRLLHDMSLFLKQRYYGEDYDFHGLQKDYLDSLKDLAQDYEKQTIYQLGEEIDKLEDEKNKYSELIRQLENEWNVLQNQNEILEEELSFYEEYSILDKGDIKEYYQCEQKDIVLDMLEDDVKKRNVGDLDMEILEDILQQNPKDGTRDEYLEKILNVLKSSYDIYKLKKYGIYIKGDKSKHPIAVFFDNSRYQSTISSTPSDQKACRQIFRQFRKYFF